MFTRMKLRHYGATHYNPSLFKPISDVPFFSKPRGGLWTSPVGAEYGWRHWCEDEGFGNLNDYFDLEFNGTILKIESVADLDLLPWVEQSGVCFVSFQALCSPEFVYGAIHLTTEGQEKTRFTYPRSLYGWDCETVLVMNPRTITFSAAQSLL